ncbi:hypothetical protein CANCADRAFT_67704 [Tortispora caseinolytica NRRL Y-17796]|uniref:Uncharacterized protein n=1 Tax=Tortispora caseinolytica NRRL Y-17796 TaxID=767744 RepID=A0A1E4TM01_9ASCO|nr:hypothetical protein CANCADRAFT_67704 [Tortispora caseinolytica NRRL Y-17796]
MSSKNNDIDLILSEVESRAAQIAPALRRADQRQVSRNARPTRSRFSSVHASSFARMDSLTSHYAAKRPRRPLPQPSQIPHSCMNEVLSKDSVNARGKRETDTDSTPSKRRKLGNNDSSLGSLSQSAVNKIASVPIPASPIKFNFSPAFQTASRSLEDRKLLQPKPLSSRKIRRPGSHRTKPPAN